MNLIGRAVIVANVKTRVTFLNIVYNGSDGKSTA